MAKKWSSCAKKNLKQQQWERKIKKSMATTNKEGKTHWKEEE